MRLDEITSEEFKNKLKDPPAEITKDEFVRKLKDPVGEAIHKEFSDIQQQLKKLGWYIELTDIAPGEIYIKLFRWQDTMPMNKPNRVVRLSLFKLGDEYDIKIKGGELNQRKGVENDWHITYEN